MTPEQVAIIKTSNLAAIKALVPGEVDPASVSAEDGDMRGSLLSLNIQYHKCTEEGHQVIQYLIDQGADVNQENPMVGRLTQTMS